MEIEVFEDYNNEGAGIGKSGKIIFRKPFPREIWKIQNLDPDNINNEESYETVAGLVRAVIVKYPPFLGGMADKLDVDKLPADIFFTIFRLSAQSTLKETKKLSEI